MFYSTYKSIQTALLTVTKLTGTQWFNMQYESTIALTPVVLVEFPEDNSADRASKDVTRLPFRVRVHVVTKVIAGANGEIRDSLILDNETLALAVKGALVHLPITGGTPLRFAGWVPWQRQYGYMVTLIDFTSRINEA